MGMRRGSAAFGIAFVGALAGCTGPIKEQKNAYSYAGRIVERVEDTVTEPRSRATNDPTGDVLRGMSGTSVVGAAAGIAYESLPKTKKETYQRYKVALEQGETITLRSYATDLVPNECVKVWILGPGVSPVYWYAPDQAQLEKSTDCGAK